MHCKECNDPITYTRYNVSNDTDLPPPTSETLRRWYAAHGTYVDDDPSSSDIDWQCRVQTYPVYALHEVLLVDQKVNRTFHQGTPHSRETVLYVFE